MILALPFGAVWRSKLMQTAVALLRGSSTHIRVRRRLAQVYEAFLLKVSIAVSQHGEHRG